MHQVKCFSCKLHFLSKHKNSYNFCNDCFLTYLVRSNGSRLEGMDYSREIVRIRDNHTCQLCKTKWVIGKRRFDIHHKGKVCGTKSRSYDRLKDIGKLQTLCHSCHIGLDSVRRKISKRLSKVSDKQKKYQRDWAVVHRSLATAN